MYNSTLLFQKIKRICLPFHPISNTSNWLGEGRNDIEKICSWVVCRQEWEIFILKKSNCSLFKLSASPFVYFINNFVRRSSTAASSDGPLQIKHTTRNSSPYFHNSLLFFFNYTMLRIEIEIERNALECSHMNTCGDMKMCNFLH